MCGTKEILLKNVRDKGNPIEKCAVQMCGRTGSAGAGRDGPNIRKIPNPTPSGRTAAGRENPQSNADRPDRRRPGKSPNRRRPAGPPRRRPGKSPIRRRPAGPPPAGKIPKPNRLVLSVVAVCCRRHTGKPALPAIINKSLTNQRRYRDGRERGHRKLGSSIPV